MRAPLTREAVVGAARDIITAEGLDAVSLRRVAAALHVTAPALYAHVTDKQDLLKAIAEDEFDALVARFDEIDATDPIDRMRALARAYVAHVRANPELFKVMFLFPPDLAQVPATGNEIPAATKAFEVPTEAARRAIEAGRLRPDADLLVVTLTAWASMHGVATVLQLGFGFDEAFEDRLVDSVIETTLRGLQP